MNKNSLVAIAFFVGTIIARESLAQSSSDLVQRAIQNRDSVKASKKLFDAAVKIAAGLGSGTATRLELGSGSRPDVGGGEDLTLFQPLDLFGKSRAASAGGRAGIRVAESALRQTKLDVQTEVLGALATWSNAERNLLTANNQLEITLQLEHATKVRVDARALPELQLTRATLERERAEQVVVDRQASVQTALIKLTQAVGGDRIDGANLDFGSPEIGTSHPENHRPELMSLAAQRGQFQADERQAKLSALPDFELQARRNPWSTSEGYGIRFQFVVPLWDHGASRNKASSARLQAAATDLQYADIAKRISAEIESARIQVAAANKSLTAYSKLAAGSKVLLEKTQRGFELGATTLIDVLDAKRALSDSLEQMSNAKFSVDQSVIELLRAQGQILGETQR